ncbi:hypothetical protein J6590_041286 [Homalodisca vitripennis]|nr:hypothetical protein J6590_041286 [Homalodisca vitripennis]
MKENIQPPQQENRSHFVSSRISILNFFKFQFSDLKTDVSMIREGGLVRHMPATYPINHTLRHHGNIYHPPFTSTCET